jgi:hypothetical protein
MVMPLPVKKKYGINYIIQPWYTQQLGIFADTENYHEKIDAFINKIPAFYRYVDINLNHSNDPSGLSYLAEIRKNYELSLSKNREELLKNYSGNTVRNLQKTSAGIEIRENLLLNEMLRLLRDNPVHKMNSRHFEWLKYFMEEIVGKNAGFAIGAFYKNILCAGLFLIKYKSRIYYLIPVSDSIGKDQRAMFAIIDYIITKFSGTDTILDFEGSNIEGIARFFEGFGAMHHNYSRIRINSLPFPLKIFMNI